MYIPFSWKTIGSNGPCISRCAGQLCVRTCVSNPTPKYDFPIICINISIHQHQLTLLWAGSPY